MSHNTDGRQDPRHQLKSAGGVVSEWLKKFYVWYRNGLVKMDEVEKIKQANPIQDVITEMFPLQRRSGRYMRSQEHDSLVVDTAKQTYNWNSKGEIGGDVIQWLEERQGWDFKTAVEFLARRANLPEPRWSRESEAIRQVQRKREGAFQVALGLMQKWLKEDQKALDYCHERGWTDETIQEASVCFSRGPAAAAFEDMRAEFAMHEIDPESPQAVCVLGYKGDVRGWGEKWKIQVQENWIDWGLVPGLMGKKRLVYPHIYGGRVRNISARNILGSEINRDGREVKAYNLPVALAGERQPYYNHVYRSNADECVVIEGQADAISLGQWGIAAVALAGTSWNDHQALLVELKKRHKALYLGMDADAAGMEALTGKQNDWPLGKVLGPMVRLINWEAIAG